MASQTTKLLDDVLYAICMYFAALLDGHIPKEGMVFILLMIMLVTQIKLSQWIEQLEETLWLDILKESIRTIIRTCSFLLISFFTHALSQRWKNNRDIYIAEKLLIPCLFIFVGISFMKILTNQEKCRKI